MKMFTQNLGSGMLRHYRKFVFLLSFLTVLSFANAQTTVTLIAPPEGVLCTNTFEYRVCQQSGTQAISHWIIGLNECITAADIQAVYINNSIWNSWTVGTDPSCGVYGLKWDDIQVPAGTCSIFKVVLKNSYLVSSGNWYSKYGTTCVGSGPIATPSCTKCSDVGSISDKVWNDVNKNGIQDAGETGIAGVVVSLYNAANTVIASTVTDAYGNYLFTNLETTSAGKSYQVQFSLPSGYQFTASIGAVSVTTNSDANSVTGKTAAILLTTAAPSVTYVDAGIYYTTASNIGDFVWNDLNKNGAQDVGEPGIAGVTVMLFTSAGVLVQSTVTSNNGAYLFPDIPAGNYYIVVTPPAGYLFTAKDAATDNTDSDVDAVTHATSVFAVAASTANLSVDAGLYVAPNFGASASVGDKVWLDLDADHIQDAGEPGVAGVTVKLLSSTNVIVATTVTDVFGHYIFNGLIPASYSIQFMLPSGYIFVNQTAGADLNKDSDANPATGITASFNLFNDQLKLSIDAGLRSTSANTAAIGNYVWYDLDKDGVQDDGVEPGVPGVTVKLYNASNIVVQTTTSDANGFYLFTGLPAATAYTIGFSNLPAGYAVTVTDAGADDTKDSDVNAGTGRTGTITTGPAGTVNSTVDAGLIASPNTFDSKATIGDKVWNDLNNNGLQDAGEPGIAGITVTLYAADGTTVIATTLSDAQGNYVFTNVTAGTYIIGFSNLPSGYVFATANVGLDDKDSDASAATGKTSAITLAAGEINVSVDAGVRNTIALANLGDYVWYDLNKNGLQDAGEPAAEGVGVTLYNSAGVAIQTTTTNSKGFYLFTDLSAGTYTVRFHNLPSGYTATTKYAGGTVASTANNSDVNVTTLLTDEITVGAAVTLTTSADFGIMTTTKASIGNYVWNDTDADGVQDLTEKGIAGITVTLYNNSGVAVATTVTDADGFYFFPNADPGTYTLGFSTLPANAGFTIADAGSDETDSDVNPVTRRTAAFTVVAGEAKTNLDAGLLTYLASVGNYVWNDKIQNGIQDPSEQGIPGITVTLYSPGADGNIGTADDFAVAAAVSDANGYYFINNIPVGSSTASYYIRFSDLQANNIFTMYNEGTTDNNSNVILPLPTDGKTALFTLAGGQINLSIDAGIVGPDNSTLPADGLKLSALLSGNQVFLNWETLSEIDTDRFEVERSVISNGGFVKMGIVNAAGNSVVKSDYSLQDNAAAFQSSSVLYYRVKLIDADGKYKYSNVVVVRLASTSIKVWPNPFTESVQVSVNSESAANIQFRVSDLNGRTVFVQSAKLSRGMNQVNVQQSGTLASGQYIFEVINEADGTRTAFKITKN